MNMKQKIILSVLTLLVVGLAIFAVSKLVNRETPQSEPAQIEQVQKTETPAKTLEPKSVNLELSNPDSIPQNSSGSRFLYTLLIFMTFALFASIYLTIYLLNWRHKISDTQVSVVPQELLKILETQIGGFNQYDSYVSEYIKRISQDREKTDTDIQELQKSFVVFQDSLNKKDQEIERYKKGYDSAVYKKFLGKFIKFYVALKKEADAPENSQSAEAFNYMLEMLEDALLECNVEVKSPLVNAQMSDYQDLIGGHKKSVSTNQQELHGTIAEILFPAFVLKTQAGEEVLREANIAIYVYEESEAA